MEYTEWVKNKAKELRANPTESESRIINFFKENKIRYKFQQPIFINDKKGYIADFVLFNKVILEIDGSSHNDSKEYDKQRTAELESKGFIVIRMRNGSTSKSNIERVLVNRFEKVQPKVAERLKKNIEQREKQIKKDKYKRYKQRLPDWDFREKIWDYSGGHYKYNGR